MFLEELLLLVRAFVGRRAIGDSHQVTLGYVGDFLELFLKRRRDELVEFLFLFFQD